jgi:hypothetical protein
MLDALNATGLFGKGMTPSQLAGVSMILDVARDYHVTHQAYLLATAYHETGTLMRPIKETVMASHKDKNPTDATVIARLDRAFAKGQLSWVKTPYWRDGWFGRGLVQITHEANYRKASALVGIDLVAHRERALELPVAAVILVEGSRAGMFTGKKLSDYLPGDYVGARRIINGTDRAKDIAGYAEKFEAALRAMPTKETPPAPVTPPPVAPTPTGWAVLLAFLFKLLSGRK